MPLPSRLDRNVLWITLGAFAATGVTVHFVTPWLFSDLSQPSAEPIAIPAPLSDPAPLAPAPAERYESPAPATDPAPVPAARPADAAPARASVSSWTPPPVQAPTRPSAAPPVVARPLKPYQDRSDGFSSGGSRASLALAGPAAPSAPAAAAPAASSLASPTPPRQAHLEPFAWDRVVAAMEAATGGSSTAQANSPAEAPRALRSLSPSSPRAPSAAASGGGDAGTESTAAKPLDGAGGFASEGGGNDSSSNVPAEGNSAIVKQAEAFMMNPPINPDNGSRDWNDYCLGFVGITARTALGHNDSGLAGYPCRVSGCNSCAEGAYYDMKNQGRLGTDVNSMPAGAAVFWPNVSSYGHIAIFTGKRTSKGEPIFITTTGWNGWSGIKEMSQSQLGLGPPNGWAVMK